MNPTSIFLQTLIGGIGIGSLYALVALGYSMVFRSMGLVNFAHGSIYMVGTYFGIIWYRGMVLGLVVPYPAAFLIGILLSALLGVVLERLFRPLAKLDLMFMLLGTIGLGYVLDNVMTIVFGAEGFAVDSPLPNTPIKIAGILVLPQMLLLIGVSTLLMIGLQIFLATTKTGKAMRASAMDREIASAMGIPVNRMNALTLAIGSGLAAAAGILAAPIVYVNPAMGAGRRPEGIRSGHPGRAWQHSRRDRGWIVVRRGGSHLRRLYIVLLHPRDRFCDRFGRADAQARRHRR